MADLTCKPSLSPFDVIVDLLPVVSKSKVLLFEGSKALTEKPSAQTHPSTPIVRLLIVFRILLNIAGDI